MIPKTSKHNRHQQSTLVIASGAKQSVSLPQLTNEQRSKRRRSLELRRLWARPFIDSFIKPIGLLVSRNDERLR